jgi:hypothetical protein
MHWLPVVVVVGLAGGCGSVWPTRSSTVPVEYLDERTGMTVGALKEPIELVPSVQSAARFVGKRTSFAYLGPVEWDRMGAIEYGMWVHVAPGGDRQIADIRAAGSITLILDDGPMELMPIDAPQLGKGAYQPVASWGQTAYFGLTVETLRRVAASQKLQLDVRTSDNSIASFFPSADTHAVLNDFLRDRAITGD